jgi:hypothetical protein
MRHSRILLIAFCFITWCASSQDVIYKTNGDSIKAKILEVGTNAVSFKKSSNPDGPTFVESKSDIFMIRFKDGQIQEYANLTPANTSSSTIANNPLAASTGSINKSSPTGTTSTSESSGKIKIEVTGKKYTINGQKASRKEVDRQLAKSNNPAITLPLKAAKMTATAQKIVKITSIPTTVGGGFTTLFTGVNMWNDIQRGRADSKSYMNAVVSLLSTITLPITNKILKNKSDKMYDKLIDMYNLTN